MVTLAHPLVQSGLNKKRWKNAICTERIWKKMVRDGCGKGTAPVFLSAVKTWTARCRQAFQLWNVHLSFCIPDETRKLEKGRVTSFTVGVSND